jgi:hypothetical protein
MPYIHTPWIFHKLYCAKAKHQKVHAVWFHLQDNWKKGKLTYINGKESVVTWSCGGGDLSERGPRELSGVIEMFYFLLGNRSVLFLIMEVFTLVQIMKLYTWHLYISHYLKIKEAATIQSKKRAKSGRYIHCGGPVCLRPKRFRELARVTGQIPSSAQ